MTTQIGTPLTAVTPVGRTGLALRDGWAVVRRNLAQLRHAPGEIVGAVLFPIIMAFCSIGVYSVNSNVYDLFAVAFFGLIGYVLAKLRCEPAPLLLGFVLGPLLEENLRRAMILSRGDPTTFVTRPISATLLAIALAVLIVVFLPSVKKKREEVFVEET